MPQRRSFRPEVKLEICRQLINGGKDLAQVCSEYSLAESTVIHWLKAYQEHGEQAFKASASHLVQDDHVAELERFCGQLALENRLLKRALQRVGISRI
jgi:transposase